MNLLTLLVVLETFVRVNSNTGIVDHSTSPDGKYHLENTFASDGTYFAVVDQSGKNVSPPFTSDFGVLRSIKAQCEGTKVYWRKDGAFFVLDTGHDRHHGDFLIVRKTGKSFELVPFNAGKIYETSKQSAAFLYPEVIDWQTNGNLKMRITGFNGLDDYRPVDFTLNPMDGIRIASMEIGPERKQ
jgi:hypothetical protein